MHKHFNFKGTLELSCFPTHDQVIREESIYVVYIATGTITENSDEASLYVSPKTTPTSPEDKETNPSEILEMTEGEKKEHNGDDSLVYFPNVQNNLQSRPTINRKANHVLSYESKLLLKKTVAILDAKSNESDFYLFSVVWKQRVAGNPSNSFTIPDR